MKRLIGLLFILMVVISGTFYLVMGSSKAKLTEPVEMNKVNDDFILHVRAERTDQGFQVLRSLEYKGEEQITIMHRTPLISISVEYDKPRFTGSPVTQTLDPGDVYYPQEPRVYSSLEKGEYTLFANGQFYFNGQIINIKSEETIQFQ
ncbi:hypothetical protein NC797_04595 [Aquibacillus sp. 3ASR75-11]|uniref:Uncharacterized protein n=1 Tax=Terrihalobacillus insolitus TaxID=2950438 RepID=A0A9X4AKX9_9BACI|nr:hypothetical protein [Terrihalobacillus insolitus]MDC3412736.1 hypothetical protein [Terrihalobacillus insolitus]MDC3423787.1 hypothetical protein [Terrihalobacillus insolitus]